MNSRRNTNSSRLLGPKAIAIVSCALALLAAQPLGSAAATRTTQTPVLGAIAQVAPPGQTTICTPGTPRRRIAAQPTRLADRATIRVLATVEILKRYLLAELNAGAPQHTFTLALFQPPILLPFEAPVAALHFIAIPAAGPPPTYERAFSISRHLLAPPLA